ncbi:hypothetical protein VaNZ11_016620 [Volvox africanus]|uniref:Reverse transcriptase Ty1/copia-type domain-containing protein n=1 Tax=Volvox africanus TaxID=51714 RepID=A0ABQ5SQ23_9CHLO|nr:hypothetical protein VaNZ11_016620 [Volvox africanus]
MPGKVLHLGILCVIANGLLSGGAMRNLGQLQAGSMWRQPQHRPVSGRRLWMTRLAIRVSHYLANGTWTLERPPLGTKLIPCRWVYKEVKRNQDGSVERFKARLEAKGFVQQRGWIMVSFLHQHPVAHLFEPS